MKVTVNFGAVRVIVPCGDGSLLVKQLMELALTRYKKATGKDSDIRVLNLKVLSDGGILDPDDILNDVVDDREQIIATFGESGFSYLHHNGGDGTSASSVGTESPDIFQNGDLISLSSMKKPFYNGSDVEITAVDVSSGILPLHVRRGSEPALNQLSPLSNLNSAKRWSAAIMGDGNRLNFNSEGETSENESPPGEREDGSGEEKSSPIHDQRREPLGGPITSPKLSRIIYSKNQSSVKSFEVVKLKNEDGPLGIHVVPASDSPGKDYGLVIQGIDPGGRIDRDGRFNVGDKITEINGVSLSKDMFKNTQEIFKDALKASEISISCVKKNSTRLPNMLSKKQGCLSPVPMLQKRETDSSDGYTEDEKGFMVPRPKFTTPTKRPAVFNKTPSSAHSSLRKIGRRILVHLRKGQAGLGFIISSKDSSSSSSSSTSSSNLPSLFIKNILPTGAAVEDGRLKVGDKILEINRTDVTGLTQSEVVNMLRKIPFGDSVELILSRPETDISPSPHLPRELPPEKAGDGVGVFPWNKRDVFTFEIPLNDTGSAGLGVSVKGKTSNTTDDAIDMGIFVKSVIHGGAASKDGRLRPNDQLLNINGISLLTMTNSQAMETLRRSMIQGEGPNTNPNAITLTVARRIPSPLPVKNGIENGDSSSHERSDSLLSESGESFHVSNENLLSPTPNKSKGLTPDTSVSDNSGNTVICLSKSHNSAVDDSTNVEENNNSMNSYELKSKDVKSVRNNQILERLGWQQLENELGASRVSRPSMSQNGWDTDVNSSLTLLDVDPSEHHVFAADRKRRNERDRWEQSLSRRSSRETLCKSPVASPSRRDIIQRASQRERSKFSRNGFGRQSMPEKELYHIESDTYHNRHVTTPRSHYGHSRNAEQNIASRSTDRSSHRDRDTDSATYAKVLPNKFQKVKASRASREERNSCTWSNSADSIASLRERHCNQQGACHSPDCPYHAVPTTDQDSGSSNKQTTSSAAVGPTLGMYKSSSLESLQTLVQELKKRDANTGKDTSRGCNESFRAAVDRSYEASPSTEAMEILHENQESSASLIHRPTVSRPHIRSATVGPTADVLADKKTAKPTKKKGLLKGLGSVFKFGKSSKKNSNGNLPNKKDEKQKEQELTEARRAAEEERERIQQHYLRLVQQQQQKNSTSESDSNVRQNSERLNGHVSSPPATKRTNPSANAAKCDPTLSPQNHNRHERMHQLRAEHQRQHQRRKGNYPRDEMEELYEKQITEVVDKKKIWQRPLPPLPHQVYKTTNLPNTQEKETIEFDPLSSASKNYEIYKEMSKPGSRKGFVDPDRYSHYMNFQEIQQQLEEFQHERRPTENSTLLEIMSKFQQEVEQEQRTPSKLPKHYRHTVTSPRMRPVSDFFDYESIQSTPSPSKTRIKAGARSLPRQSFSSGRQRLPIPACMREAGTTNGSIRRDDTKYHSISSQHTNSSNLYGRSDTTNF